MQWVFRYMRLGQRAAVGLCSQVGAGGKQLGDSRLVGHPCLVEAYRLARGTALAADGEDPPPLVLRRISSHV